MYNYAVFFKIWDQVCGTAAPPPSTRLAAGAAARHHGAGKNGAAGEGVDSHGHGHGHGHGHDDGHGHGHQGVDEGNKTPPLDACPPLDPAITGRVMLYNVANFFSFFALPLALAGAPRPCLVLLAAWATGLVPFGAEAAALRACGLTRLASRAAFWDGLRGDLRVSVERDDGRPAPRAAAGTGAGARLAAGAPLLAAVVSLPHPLSALLLAGKKGDEAGAEKGGGAEGRAAAGKEVGSGAGGAGGGGGRSPPPAPRSPSSSSPSSSPLIRVRAQEEAAPRTYFVKPEQEEEQEVEEEAQHQTEEGPARPPPLPATTTPPAVVVAAPAQAPLPADAATAAAAFAAASADDQRPCLYVYHPRGDLMRGAFFAFGARGRDRAHPLADARDVRLALPPAVAAVLLRLPLLRELVALLGGVDPSSVASALRAGASVAVCLPGPPRLARREQGAAGAAPAPSPLSAPPSPSPPPAFVRAALAAGAALVPVVGAGEAELAGRMPLRDKLVMPSRPGRPVRVVFGEPVVAAEGESAQHLRLRFAAALASLAAQHGAPPPEAADL